MPEIKIDILKEIFKIKQYYSNLNFSDQDLDYDKFDDSSNQESVKQQQKNK